MTKSAEKSAFPFPRHEVRRGLVGEFPARLRVNENSHYSDYVLIDVTSRGLGLVIKDSVNPKDKLQFDWDQQSELSKGLVFKVVWVRLLEDFLKVTPKQDFYRVGLLLVSGCEDLFALCRQLPTVHVEQ